MEGLYARPISPSMSINWLAISIVIVIFVIIVLIILLRFKRKTSNRFVGNYYRDDLAAPSKQTRPTQQASKLKDGSSSLQKLDINQQYPQQQQQPKLTSALRVLLVSGRWEEADRETLRIMLKIAGREQQGWLDVASIQNFPLEELYAIDRLWVESSNGWFGFSVQQQIWENVGGNLKANDKIYEAFGDIVGWRVDKKWLQLDELTFDISSPVGHLPAIAVRLGGLGWGVNGFWWERRDAYVFLLSQNVCDLFQKKLNGG